MVDPVIGILVALIAMSTTGLLVAAGMMYRDSMKVDAGEEMDISEGTAAGEQEFQFGPR
jgi:hypothetical protein